MRWLITIAGDAVLLPDPKPRPTVWQCPRCLKRYPRAGYWCLGGWQTYPDRDGPLAQPHRPTLARALPDGVTP